MVMSVRKVPRYGTVPNDSSRLHKGLYFSVSFVSRSCMRVPDFGGSLDKQLCVPKQCLVVDIVDNRGQVRECRH